MNDIMDMLVDNYILVALGSAFLIIVLIGIIISNNRKKKKAKNPDMVSMSDVTTGSINDVANNLNAQNNMGMPAGMRPLNVAEVHPSVNQSVEEPASKDLYAPIGNTPVTPVAEVKPVPTVDANPYGAPAGQVVPEPKEPTFEPVFGPQAVEPVKPVEIPSNPVEVPVQPIPTTPVVESVQEIPSVPVQKPEVLDVMDVEPITPTVEANPLNGDAPVVDQNNNQNI